MKSTKFIFNLLVLVLMASTIMIGQVAISPVVIARHYLQNGPKAFTFSGQKVVFYPTSADTFEADILNLTQLADCFHVIDRRAEHSTQPSTPDTFAQIFVISKKVYPFLIGCNGPQGISAIPNVAKMEAALLRFYSKQNFYSAVVKGQPIIFDRYFGYQSMRAPNGTTPSLPQFNSQFFINTQIPSSTEWLGVEFVSQGFYGLTIIEQSCPAICPTQ